MSKLLATPLLELIWRTTALRSGIVLCVGLTLIASAAEIGVALLLIPILASIGVDAGDELGDFAQRLHPLVWLLLFAVAGITRSITNWQSTIQNERGTHELTVSMQTRLYRALAGAHWDAVRRVSPPTLANALQTQAYLVADGFSSLVQTLSGTLLIAGYIASAAFVFPMALPFVFAILLLMWWLNTGRSGRVLEHADDYCVAQEDLHQRYEDWIAISRIASLGVDSASLARRFEADAQKAASHAVNISHSVAFTRIAYDIGIIVAILVGVPVAWRLETPPALLAFGLLMLVRVLPRVASIHSGYQGMVSAVAPVRAITDLTDQLDRDPANRVATNGPLEWRELELASIGVEDTMRNSGRRWILQEISLHVRHGEWLAITGPTGSGKTTLADVMLTLVRPDSGRLQIDNTEVKGELASRWRYQAAYVPQDVVLFDASVRANLRLYVPDATDTELKNALRQSVAEFVFETLPDGLDTQVGPGGRWLSGGERQRIGIARALLRKPGILVLDEPTATLDVGTQERLMAALSNLDHKMTVVFITHRLELLQLADKIIGIEDGTITRRDDGFRRSDPDPDPR